MFKKIMDWLLCNDSEEDIERWERLKSNVSNLRKQYDQLKKDYEEIVESCEDYRNRYADLLEEHNVALNKLIKIFGVFGTYKLRDYPRPTEEPEDAIVRLAEDYYKMKDLVDKLLDVVHPKLKEEIENAVQKGNTV